MRRFLIACSLLALLAGPGCQDEAKVEDTHAVKTPEGTTTTTETTKVETDKDRAAPAHEPGDCPKNPDGSCACPKNKDGTCACCCAAH